MMENGQFPVEIRGASLAKCEKARKQIQDFLASPSIVLDVSKTREERKLKLPEKVMLEFSPRKARPMNALRAALD